MYTVNGDTQSTIRLAVSGTYSTGKSTTAEALAIATGIPRTHALTARELLLELAPGKTLTELTSIELTELGLRRFEERVHNEAGTESFISDGSVVHEWIYGEARMRVGINPGATWILRAVKNLAGLGRRKPYQQYMDVYGEVVRERAKGLYDAYVHLPVEFPLKADGHRPVSEPFRQLSDQLLIETLDQLGIEYHVVGGSVHERVERIIQIFEMPVVVSLEHAIEQAHARVAKAIAIIEEDEQFKAAQRKKSIARRLAYAMRY